jgi:uncharacterized protein YbbC (DUF1343 family)
MPKILFGIDNLIQCNPSWKKDRIGLLTNDGSHTNDGELSRLTLLKKQFNITKLFSPEHGIGACFKDGSKVMDAYDEKTGLFVYSLYNETIGVPAHALDEIDIVLVDLQDVGARCYTYLWSAFDLMCTCADLNIPMVILDRPNPLGGNIENAEGPQLEKNCESFLGRCNIPFTHYCSIAELLLFLNNSQGINASLDIFKCSWRRHDHFLHWEVPWKSPSPGLKSFNACMLYPALCFFEATNLSLARTERFSFEFIGSKWFKNDKLVVFDLFEVNNKAFSYKDETSEIQGYLLSLMSPVKFPVLFGLKLLYEIKNMYSAYFQWSPYPTQANISGDNHLDLLIGIKSASKLFELDSLDFHYEISKKLRFDWKNQISTYLLYN